MSDEDGSQENGRRNGQVRDEDVVGERRLEERVIGNELLDDATRVALLDEAHEFPGPFKIVVIAHAGQSFADRLTRTLEQEQGDDPYSVEPRESRHGTYISYRIEVHVVDAQTALERKDTLAELDGVLTLL